MAYDPVTGEPTGGKPALPVFPEQWLLSKRSPPPKKHSVSKSELTKMMDRIDSIRRELVAYRDRLKTDSRFTGTELAGDLDKAIDNLEWVWHLMQEPRGGP